MKVSFDEKSIKWGLTVFAVALCSIIAFFAIYRIDEVEEIVRMGMDILAPFIYGLIMAYLLCPVYNFTVRNVHALMNRSRVRIPKSMFLSKATGTVVAVTAMLVVIVGVMWMIIPGLVENIAKIIDMLPSSMESLQAWIDIKTVNLPQLQEVLDGWIDNLTRNVVEFVTQSVLPEYSYLATRISQGVIGVLNIIKNFFIAIIICVYFLNSKDVFTAQMKKIIMSLFRRETAEEILRGAAFTHRTFGGFINGKIIDSMIIGMICFVVMSIFDWEYILLISCIIGITNVIPFFGPFIGAIPSALLLFMVDYHQCIYFLIFILILQQFDGNILGPKILGDSTGLASFWVLFAVLVGGGMFGFVGMVLGIPIFAVIYAYISRAVNSRLSRKGLPVALDDYKVDVYSRDSRRLSLREKKVKNDRSL